MGNCNANQQKQQVSSEVLWENRWAEQSAQIEANPLYSLLDAHGGGRLIDCYELRGIAAVRRLIKEEVTHFLYRAGAGIEISGNDLITKPVTKYEVPDDDPLATRSAMVSSLPVHHPKASKMKQQQQQKTKVPLHLFNAASEVYGSSGKQLVCWDITKRGIFGETLLHLCFVTKTPAHRQLAKVLLEEFPNLAKDIFVGWEYFGQSALHMAIINEDLEMCKLLVSYGADISQRAVGDFFQPEDQRGLRKAKLTNYWGHSYYGEYPLAFAGCCGSTEIYDYLVVHGADPKAKDLYGNSILHMLVIHNQTEVYRLALRHHKQPADAKALNQADMNPISLAAKLGRRQVFNEIIDLSAAEMWRYSNITCKVYPLTGLDTISASGRTDWDSAFMYIINGRTTDHLDMLDEGVIGQLLAEKWQKYIKNRFLQRFVLIIAHLLIMSIAVYLRPQTVANSNANTAANGTVAADVHVSTREVFRYIFEAITVMNSVLTLGTNFDEVREQGVLSFFKGLADAPPRASFLFACLLIALALPARLLSVLVVSLSQEFEQVEESLLTLAIPCMWSYLLFFAGGTQLNGTFVTMIYKMIGGDLLRFSIIYAVILICFAQAYYFLFRDIEQITINSFRDPYVTLMTLFQMTLGEFKMSKGQYLIKYDEFNYTRYRELSKIVFAMFMVLMPIMLLNMLIAMMGNTYNMVNSRSQKEWIAMWAKIVVIIERSYSPKQLLRFKSEYAIPVPGRDGEVGLMTIYRTKKTLAKQRRTASNNWKRSFRKVLQLTRDHKELGNETPFTFDGSEQSLSTIRQQKARLVAMQRNGGKQQKQRKQQQQQQQQEEELKPNQKEKLGRALDFFKKSSINRAAMFNTKSKPTDSGDTAPQGNEEIGESIQQIMATVSDDQNEQSDQQQQQQQQQSMSARKKTLANNRKSATGSTGSQRK